MDAATKEDLMLQLWSYARLTFVYTLIFGGAKRVTTTPMVKA
jgi:hypothetical protein